jgi:hypothetical protein
MAYADLQYIGASSLNCGIRPNQALKTSAPPGHIRVFVQRSLFERLLFSRRLFSSRRHSWTATSP